MSGGFLTGERHRGSYWTAEATHAHRPEADTAHYIDAQGVVMRLHGNPANGNQVLHGQYDARMTGRTWLAVILVALALDTVVALGVYFLLGWLWP